MEKSALLHGLQAGDKVHFDFTVGLPVVRDTIEALRLTDAACGTTDGAAAGMYYRVAVMACALTSLGDLKKEEITPELLLDNLSDDDFDIIDAEISAVKKKRMDLRSNLQATDSLPLPSENTA